jgi:hypothetical protein
MSKEIVPFSEAKLDKLEKATLFDGLSCNCGDGRSIEVWRVKETDGYCVRILRPTNDDKVSELVFGLKPPAARALAALLSKQLNGDPIC